MARRGRAPVDQRQPVTSAEQSDRPERSNGRGEAEKETHDPVAVLRRLLATPPVSRKRQD